MRWKTVGDKMEKHDCEFQFAIMLILLRGEGRGLEVEFFEGEGAA